ncbi:MAG: hypothetical protein WBE75_00030 [Candidatus Omnitrophota bacterium]
MRKGCFLFLSAIFLSFVIVSVALASADYDGESASDYVMETSSGDSMVTPASRSDDISVDSVRALQAEFLNEGVTTDDCYEAFAEWGFVPDQRVLESAVFYASAWALGNYDLDLNYDSITVGQTADNSAVSITQDSKGNVEVRFDADFLKEYELNGQRDGTLNSVIEGYQEAATNAVKEAVSALYDDGKGTTAVEGTILSELIVPEEESSTGACIPVECLPDKFIQELQLTAASFAVENDLYSLESDASEYFQNGYNPYKGITASFTAFADNIKHSYADLSDYKISSGVALNTANGTLAVDPTYAVDMANNFHNGYAAESVNSYAGGLYSAWISAQRSVASAKAAAKTGE